MSAFLFVIFVVASVASFFLWVFLTVSAFRTRLLYGLLCLLFPPFTYLYGFRFYRGQKAVAYTFVVTSLIPLYSIYKMLSSSGIEGEISQPKEAAFSIEVLPLYDLSNEARENFFRYLAGNFQWEIIKERDAYFAIRRQAEEQRLRTSLNGFYSNANIDRYLQTRILISFTRQMDFGKRRDILTELNLVPGTLQVNPNIEEPHTGAPGQSSYLIFKSPGLNLEVYEQSSKLQRVHTQKAFAQFQDELQAVMRQPDQIQERGVLSGTNFYPSPELIGFKNETNSSGEPALSIEQDSQGIYWVSAWVPSSEKGETFLRVFNQSTGEQLSEPRIGRDSLRVIGWSSAQPAYFPYQSYVTVYEGDWSHEYEARFELWFRSLKTGMEKKITEKVEKIYGWQR